MATKGPMTLANLQTLCKKDPDAYREEFLVQLRHFQSQLQLHSLTTNHTAVSSTSSSDGAAQNELLDSSVPTNNNNSRNSLLFQQLVNFLAHVASAYPKDLQAFPLEICKLLENNGIRMNQELRKNLVKSLILMRNKNLISPMDILPLFFKLFRCPDKQLRVLLYSHIVSDIRNINAKHKNNRVNNALQNFMFTIIQDNHDTAAKKAMEIVIELYRKNIWNDSKAVNIISHGAFSTNSKILVSALHFFLGAPASEDSEDEEEKLTKAEIYRKHRHSKKTRAKDKKTEKLLSKLNQHKTKKKSVVNFPAIELLHDPQGYVEKLFGALKGKHSNQKFDVRLMIMNFISRLIGCHKLLLLSFYSYLQKYLRPKQENVTYLLAILAQSCHDLVPPDVLEPIIKDLANNFVSDRSSNQVVAVGLNTIREICARCPFAMNSDLLQDLVQYKSSREKAVVMAARGLINLFREVNPSLLHRRDRGKDHDKDARSLEYGEARVPDSIEGIGLLEQDILENGEDGDADQGEVEEDVDQNDNDSEDEEGEFEAVNSDEDQDSDDEENDGEEEPTQMHDGLEYEEVELDGHLPLPAEGEEESESEGEGEGESDSEAEDGEEAEEDDEDTLSVSSNSQDNNNNNAPLRKQRHLDSMKILTQEDFERLQRLKAEQKNQKKRAKAEPDSDSDDNAQTLGVVDPVNLLGLPIKRRKTKEERLESVLAGREGREAFGKKRKEKKGGTTNEEKLKSKPFMLVKFKQGIQGKKKRSAKQQARLNKKHVQHLRGIKQFK